MPTFTATLSDGREVEFEADQEPSHDELLSAVSSWKEPSTEVPAANEIPKIGLPDLSPVESLPDVSPAAQMKRLGGVLFDPLTSYLPESFQQGLTAGAEKLGAASTSPLSIASGGFAAPLQAVIPRSILDLNPLTTPLAPKVGAGIGAGVKSLAEGLLSPVGLASLGFGEIPVAAQRALSLAFAGQMVATSPELARQLGEEFANPPAERDNSRIAQLLTEAAGTAGFAALAAKHGLTGPKERPIVMNQRESPLIRDQPAIPGDFSEIKPPTTGEPNASRIQEAATIHGDVRPFASEGEGQVSAAEGGRGVQPRAEAGPETRPEGVLLSDENQRYLDEERKAIDVPVEMVLDIPEGHPFAGLVGSIDRKNGRIIVNPDQFNRWIKTVPVERRQQAVRSLLSEERIHLATPDEMAQQYGQTLTSAEKLIAQRIYGGKNWRQTPLNDLQLGHEALRYRMQQLSRMTPREVAEAALRERWTVQGLDIIARTIQKTRETLGTKASKEGLAILGQIEKNLGTAQAAVGSAPGATIKERLDKLEEDEQRGIFKKPNRVPVTVEGPDGKTYQATFDGIQDWSSLGRGVMRQITLQEEIPGVSPQHGTTYAETLAKKGFTVKGIPEETPGVRMKGGDEEKSPGFFLPPLPNGASVERPGAVELGAEPVTPAKVSEVATQHLTDYPKPSFNEFVRESKRRFGDVQPGQVREAWEDAVWKRVQNASGPELEAMRDNLKLARNYGRRQVAGEQEVTLPPSLEGLNREARKRAEEARRIANSRQNYRKAVQSAVARKLIEQSYEGESLKKALGRTELTADDLAQNRPNMFEEISREDAASPERLSRIILENFRASSALAESNTRRVVALVNRKTGATSLVSVYEHPRSGPMVVNPASSTSLRPNVPLASVLKEYTPIATALLDEPVKNFSQRFESVGEFNQKFADDARNAVQSQASYESSLGEGAGVIDPNQSSPSALRSGKPLMDAEAGGLLDHLMDEHQGKIEGPQDVDQTIRELAIGNPNWQVISAYNKIYDAIREKRPDLSPEQALTQTSNEIYEAQRDTKTRDEFAKILAERYGGDTGDVPQGEAVAGTQPLPSRESPGAVIKDAKERASRWLKWAKGPANPVPEAVDVDMTHAVPRFPANIATALTRATGVERIPLIGKVWGPRARIVDAADRELVAHDVKVQMGKSLAVLAGKELKDTEQQLGNPFQQAKDGAYTNLDAAKGASLYPSDVFEQWQRETIIPEEMKLTPGITAADVAKYQAKNPPQYRLTREQDAMLRKELEYVRDAYKYLDEKRASLDTGNAQPIPLPSFGGELAVYPMPRPVLYKKATGPIKTEISRRIGGSYEIEQERLYKTEQRGAETTVYEPDVANRIVTLMNRVYKAVADADIANSPALKGKTVDEMRTLLSKEYEPELRSGEMTLDNIEQMARQGRRDKETTVEGHPATAGKVFPIEMANKIEKAFGTQKHPLLTGAGELSGLQKSIMLTGATTHWLQQALPMMFRNPKGWGRAVAGSIRSLWNPNVLGEVMRDPAMAQGAREFVQNGESLGHLFDFMSAAQPGELSTRIPFYRHVIQRSGQSFGALLDLSKLYQWQALKNSVPREEWPQLARTIGNVTGGGKSELIGLHPGRKHAEQIGFMAASYYRASVQAMAEAVQGAAHLSTGTTAGHAAQVEAFKTVGGFLAFTTLGMGALYAASGMNRKEIEERLTPSNKNFLTYPVKIGGKTYELGVQHFILRMVRAMGATADAMLYHPKDFLRSDDKNPVMHFLYGTLGPVPALIQELRTGKDYSGRQVSPLEAVAGTVQPIPAITGERSRKAEGLGTAAIEAAASFVGLRERVASNAGELRTMVNDYLKTSGEPKLKHLWEVKQQQVGMFSSDYRDLRTAVANDDLKAFKQEIAKLKSIGKTDKEIKDAMEAEKPITGLSRDEQLKFQRSLNNDEIKVFKQAEQDRKELKTKFEAMLKNGKI